MSSSMVKYEISKFWAPSSDAKFFIALMLDLFQTTSEVISSQLSRIKQWNLVGIQPVATLDTISMNKPHRSIMVIGETGTGKSTLLNSMANYLWNVEYDDPHRFKLIYEPRTQHGDAQSVTNHVTAYHLDPPALDYQLTLIDTPGFGDTRGLARDQTITRQIKQFFEEKIQEIDAICFVVRAPQARLTATQKYIFNQVLSIFGQDIADNILVLMTFADGKKPPVLSALKAGNVPFTHSFKLNNSAFDLREFEEKEEDQETDEYEDDDMFTRMFWEMGVASFRNFFCVLDTLETKSLRTTKHVLSQREQLDHYMQCMQPLIRSGSVELERIRQHMMAIRHHDAVMDANKDFTYTENVRKSRQVPSNGNTTICLECNWNCHQRCPYSDNADKSRCAAMDGTGHCRVCPSKCHWSLHKSKPYTIEWYQAQQTRTVQEMKDKYHDAMNKKCAEVRLMATGALSRVVSMDAQLGELVHKSYGCLNKLKDIALRADVILDGDYMDRLLQSEENEKASGWHQRVSVLRGLKEKQDTLSDIGGGKYNPWRPYLDVQRFVCKNENVLKVIKDEAIVKMLANWSTLLY